MLPIIFALVALLGWGVGDVFVTFATRKIGAYSSSFYGYFFGLLVASLYIPFALTDSLSLCSNGVAHGRFISHPDLCFSVL